MRLRSSLAIARIGVRSYAKLGIAVLGALWGVATISLGGPAAPAAIGFGLAVLGAAATAHDLRLASESARSLYIMSSGGGVAALNVSDVYKEFQDERWRGHRFLLSPDLNRQLDSMAVPIRMRGDYAPPARVEAVRYFILKEERRAGKVLFDAKKVRMAEDLTLTRLEDPTPIALEETSYFASVCTNEVVTKEIRVRATEEVRLRGIELCSSSGVLLDLSQSYCSNHVGISTLALTSDGFLITTVQASGSAQYARLIAPSGSGSADLSDVRPEDDLRAFLVRAMERELREECGLDGDQELSTVVTGYARIVDRGGKPEFFGFTKLPVSRSAISVPKKETVFVADARGHRIDRQAIGDSVRDLREQSESAFTPVMHLALRCFEDWLADQDSGTLEMQA